MCDVHLVEDVNESRVSLGAIACSSCEKPIVAGETYTHVEGHLDDGSPGMFVYDAHEDCFLADQDDVGEDGCFTWHGVKEFKKT